MTVGNTNHNGQKNKLALLRWSASTSIFLLTFGGCVGIEDNEDFSGDQALAYEDIEDDLQREDIDAEQSLDRLIEPIIEPPTDVTMEEVAAGTCLECSPEFFAACTVQTWTWTLQCTQNGCAPYANYGGGCGLCYCGNSCQQTTNTGDISASPTSVFINAGLGCTEIEWDVDCGDSQVWVSANGAPETLFAQGGSGTQDACWIQLGQSYSFRLYEGLDRSTLLDSVQVTGVSQPNVCDNCSYGTSCRCFDNVCRPDNTACP